jgi:hypothetical protein
MTSRSHDLSCSSRPDSTSHARRPPAAPSSPDDDVDTLSPPAAVAVLAAAVTVGNAPPPPRGVRLPSLFSPRRFFRLAFSLSFSLSFSFSRSRFSSLLPLPPFLAPAVVRWRPDDDAEASSSSK